MTTSLYETAQKHYSEYGYYFPMRALSAAKAYDKRARLETFEMSLSGRIAGRMWAKLYLLFTWVDNLVRNKAIFDAVEGRLGPNILCWQTSLFIKNTYDQGLVSWHQDSNYWGLSETDVCTAWVALSPATLESGAMRVLPRTQKWHQVTHTDSFDADNIQTRGQVVDAEIDEEQAIDLVLAPSVVSLHHVRLVHALEPYRSEDRSIGLAIRYVAPHARQVTGVSDSALLANGEGRYGHFDEERSLVADTHPDAVAFHTRITETREGFIYSGMDTELTGDSEMDRPPGVEFHTFTIVGRCERTGMFGIATATRSLAVGARVPHVKSQTGAVAIMAIADPRLGTAALQFLEQGYKAPTVIDQLVAMDPYAEYRQLGVIDDDGFAAARTGKMNRNYAGHHVGDSYIALGNVLVGECVLDAIEEGFLADPNDDLEGRLMCALESGRDAGGQHGGQQSAALLVYDNKSFPRVDLRVDVHAEPVGELRKVFDVFRPAIPYYNLRLVDARVPPLDKWLEENADE